MREQILSDVGMKRVPRSDAYTKSEGASKRGGDGEDGEGDEGAEVIILCAASIAFVYCSWWCSRTFPFHFLLLWLHFSI